VAAETEEFDPYSVLGVHHDATFEQVRAAFRRRAQLLHPDRHADAPAAVRAEAAAAMRELSTAFDTLRGRLVRQEPEPTPKGPRIRCPVCTRVYAESGANEAFTCACGTKLRRKDTARAEARSDGERNIGAIRDLANQGLLTADECDRLLRAARAGVTLTCTRIILALRVDYDDGRMEANEYAERRRAAVLADVHAS